MEPEVSICCITYNHEKYIRDAIESFLMQKTTFPFEIIIHDDASTDNTSKIIIEYAKKYPDLFVPILQSENQWSKGIRPSPTYVWPRVRGKYIALCEGDDYWTDSLKLQKQVDFLEMNADCSWCCHPAAVVDEDGGVTNYFMRPLGTPQNNKYTIKDVISEGGGFCATASIVLRSNTIKNLPDWIFKAPVGDAPLILIISCEGYVGYIDNIMCVRRRNVPGSWSDNFRNKGNLWNNYLKHSEGTEAYLQAFNAYSNFRFEKYLKKKIIQNKYELFLLSLRLPTGSDIWRERFQRLKSLRNLYNFNDSLCFVSMLFYDVAKRLIAKIRNIINT